jgi:hypothetical protein
MLSDKLSSFNFIFQNPAYQYDVMMWNADLQGNVGFTVFCRQVSHVNFGSRL